MTYLKSFFQGATWVESTFELPDWRMLTYLRPTKKNANLLGANLKQTKALASSQVKAAENWDKAIYSETFRQQLDLP